jgi:hypothetical protein
MSLTFGPGRISQAVSVSVINNALLRHSLENFASKVMEEWMWLNSLQVEPVSSSWMAVVSGCNAHCSEVAIVGSWEGRKDAHEIVFLL